MVRWYDSHQNLADLWRHLNAEGRVDVGEFQYFLDEPWSWEKEWLEYSLLGTEAA